MKAIEYYCGNYFNPTSGSVLTAEEWLKAKMESARLLILELQEEDMMTRNNLRINRITKAIKDWQVQLNEINGIQQEIE